MRWPEAQRAFSLGLALGTIFWLAFRLAGSGVSLHAGSWQSLFLPGTHSKSTEAGLLFTSALAMRLCLAHVRLDLLIVMLAALGFARMGASRAIVTRSS